jgi:hypothetical protein
MKQFNKCIVLTLLLFMIEPGGLKYAIAEDSADPCDPTLKYLYWVGNVDNDFFNELNWRETVQRPSRSIPQNGSGSPVQFENTACLPGANKKPHVICLNNHDPEKDKAPKAGTLTPGMPIGLNLYIKDAEIKASGEIIFGCADFGMTVTNSKLESDFAITQGIVSLDQESILKMTAGTVPAAVKFDFLDAASWIYWNGITPDVLGNSLDNHVLIIGKQSKLGSDYRVNQYYQTGSLIRPIDAKYTTLSIFSDTDFGGQQASINELTIFKGDAIPQGMNNAVRSFVLKKGYMATFAIEENGTGKSKVYIASEEDMFVNALPLALQGNVSFIRVVPWNWVTKKGTGGFFDQLDAGWYYNWGLGNTSRPNYEYVPMAWGAGGASPANVTSVANRGNVTHFLGFNESDNCNGESGQFNNLCQPEVAVAYFEGLMGSGLRLGSPAPRENGPTGWLKEFYEIAKARDVRFDFVAVHWYDWGSNPANSPNADPVQIFNRFKAYLDNVYRIYQMPIWITEFNANPNRGNAIQQAFLELALPYLESLDYVERYAYFQPNPNNAANPNVTTANYLDANGELTNIGELYLNHQSSPSIKAATYAPNNSLEGLDLPFTPKEVNTLLFEAECGQFLGSKWDVLEDENASNGIFLRGNAQNAGESPIASQVHFDFELDGSDSYRIWIRAFSTAGVNGALRFKMDNKPMEQITPFNSNEFIWFQVPRIYDLGEGKHRLTLEFPNNAIRLDQIAIINGSINFDGSINDPGYCQPTDNFWGLVQSDVLQFYEAESASFGSKWTSGVNEKAINGSFIENIGTDPSGDEVPSGSGVVEFEVNIETSDEYEIWAKIQALDPDRESSLWIAVDDQPFRKFGDLQNDLFLWYWKKFHYTYESETRSFSYFLEAGSHTVRIAYASGNVAIDRLAIASKGKNPAEVDPDVVNIIENLEFEAELATLLGNATIVNCATSSNGQQVNMGNVNSNGVLFDQIVAETAGTYKLLVSYMSAVQRSFQLTVNGQNLGQQIAISSGSWCFAGGVPGLLEIDVQLKEGVNVIRFNPFSGDAPFIDKIKLEKSKKVAPTFISLEAEQAELIGTFPSPTCATASNNQIVNMGSNVNHAIRFNEIEVAQTGTYNVAIHYFSAVQRSLRIFTNGNSRTETFAISGAWCFNGGSPAVYVMELQLQRGSNIIELRPTGSESPIIDKIVITSQETGGETFRTLAVEEEKTKPTEILDSGDFKIYPNPMKVGNPLNIHIPEASIEGGPVQVSIINMTGRRVFSNVIRDPQSSFIELEGNLARGIYVVIIHQGDRFYSKKLKVD